MHRRDFLASTAATLTGLAAAQATESEEMDPTFPIVDTHQHLWDLTRFRLPWIKPGNPLGKSHVMADYHKATADLGTFPAGPGKIAKSVYMEVDVAVEQQTEEARYVIDLCQRADNPMAGAVISGRPASEGFARYLDQFKGLGSIKGVRQVLHVDSTPAGYCLDPKFVAGIRLLGERGLSFDLCMRPEELLDAARLIDACPGTRFILDHCGNGKVLEKDRSKWQKDIAEVAQRKSVVCKISGIVAGADPKSWKPSDLAPIINHTLEVFGPDRVMFGGDWPVCTLAATFKQWVEALKGIVSNRPVAEQRKLFYDNAVRFYGLED